MPRNRQFIAIIIYFDKHVPKSIKKIQQHAIEQVIERQKFAITWNVASTELKNDRRSNCRLDDTRGVLMDGTTTDFFGYQQKINFATSTVRPRPTGFQCTTITASECCWEIQQKLAMAAIV